MFLYRKTTFCLGNENGMHFRNLDKYKETICWKYPLHVPPKGTQPTPSSLIYSSNNYSIICTSCVSRYFESKPTWLEGKSKDVLISKIVNKKHMDMTFCKEYKSWIYIIYTLTGFFTMHCKHGTQRNDQTFKKCILFVWV